MREGIDLLLASGHTEIEIAFCGGEPLLEFPTIRQAVAYAEEGRWPDQRVLYSMITNGMLLGPEVVEFLAAHRFDTQLSFDGVAGAQDLRQKGSFGSLDRLLHRLSSDHRAFFDDHFTVSLTVLPSTLASLPESIGYFYGRGLHNLVLSPLFTDSSVWAAERLPELKATMHAVAEASIDHFRETGLIPLAPFRRNGCASMQSRPVCTLGNFRVLAIDTDGETYGCVLFAESLQEFPSDFLRSRIRKLRLGKLGAADFPNRLESYPAAISAAGIFDHQEDKYSSYGRCRDCDYLSTCEICPLAIGHIPGNTDPNRIPDFLCAFNLAINGAREHFQRRVAEARTTGELSASLDELRGSRRRLERLVADLGSAAGD